MIFALCVTFMVGVWLGLYVAAVLGASKKARKKMIDDLEEVLKNIQHLPVCGDKIKAAIKFIEKYT